ncbi:MAG: hypothetical protein ACYTGG_13170, partial [Planctomycetota bacterium]
PLNPDSDLDTILDGDEVALATDPCSADTDDDGIDDSLDPLPIDPGVTSTFYEQLMLDAAVDVDALDVSLFAGQNDNQREGRRNKIASNLRIAAKAMKNADFAKAIEQLEKNAVRIDGDPLSEKDYMVESPERIQLYADHLFFIDLAILSAG